MHVSGSLSRAQIADFLTDDPIPIRLGCRTPAGELWMLSMWYRHRESDDTDDEWVLECATNADAKVVTYLRESPDVAFEVSTNRPPYRGVRGRGTATIDPDPDKTVLRALLERYLGGTDSELATNLLKEDRTEVTITISPSTVYGWNFADRMGDTGRSE
ncbi:pyridoxamine 5'-phosphate oxidase family protein [Salinadaptatus halalkaliphilus]|uniref:Pyridoxamine 5'-phosphate oxidase family protein n=1 Tax=Salinadaptatus halalkaliphilus TaxID=2419781 RepID=A0A4S3TMZ8_9EURY|nr:pyridoxamine 5'-phosphate oxidase family protein [Salinadaptatus halalkaliphilus]THE65546.1 pyridoxamine 5'-phosphate oxidase family protein [Salinadaptatus halalkaliphilus]